MGTDPPRITTKIKFDLDLENLPADRTVRAVVQNWANTLALLEETKKVAHDLLAKFHREKCNEATWERIWESKPFQKRVTGWRCTGCRAATRPRRPWQEGVTCHTCDGDMASRGREPPRCTFCKQEDSPRIGGLGGSFELT